MSAAWACYQMCMESGEDGGRRGEGEKGEVGGGEKG